MAFNVATRLLIGILIIILSANFVMNYRYNLRISSNEHGYYKNNGNSTYNTKSDNNFPTNNIQLTFECSENTKTQQIFDNIYAEKTWMVAQTESRSGIGSTIKYALETILHLKEFIGNHGIKSFADMPCGDSNWIFSVKEINTIDLYFGGDVSSSIIQYNQLLYHKHNNKLFKIWDLTECMVPQYYYNNNINELFNFDFVLTRDVLQHLSLNDSMRFIKNIVLSNITYWAVTSFEMEYNKNIENGQFYWNDLEKYPFNLSANNVNIIFKKRSHLLLPMYDENDCLIIYKIDNKIKQFVKTHFQL